MTKKFSLKQLFSLVDGRLSTNMDDVYNMLNHIHNTDLFTHMLPFAMDKVNQIRPDWYIDVESDIFALNIDKHTPWEKVVQILDANPKEYDIPQLIDNKLLTQ